MTKRGVAAFDFDGTITTKDTLVPFLVQTSRSAAALSLVRALPTIARGAGHRRDRAKARIIDGVFAGRSRAEIERAGAAYAAALPHLYRPTMLDRLRWHRSVGHETVLVTASLGVYARPAATELGFDHVIAVELASDGSGTLTGAMATANVRGPEKQTRLLAHLGASPYELWSYGNSAGDAEMLAMADHPTMVHRKT